MTDAASGGETLSRLNRFSRAPAGWPAPVSTAAFHGLAGDFVKIVEPHSEADPVALLLQFLVMAGNVIGRCAHMRVENTRHHTNLYVAVVGQTSKSRKGTSFEQAFRPFALADPQWAAERRKSGLSSGEGLIDQVRDAVLKEEDGELEIVDPGVDDKRLLVHESEMACPLKRMPKEGNSLSMILRDAWDSTHPLSTITVTKNARNATDPHISVIAHITQTELVRLLSRADMENGFANRFLWIMARRVRSLPHGGALTDADIEPIVQGLRDIANITGQWNDVQITWGEAASAHWAFVYEDLAQGGIDLAAAMTARAEAQVLRLALLYAVLDKSTTIEEAHLAAALEIWRYVRESVYYLFKNTLGDPVADKILGALTAAGPDGLRRSRIRDVFDRNLSAKEVERALLMLKQSGLAYVEEEGTAGRTAERWYAKNDLNAKSPAGADAGAKAGEEVWEK